MEIEITQIAKDKIKEEASENNIDLTVRVYVESTGCSGARFGIVFDEAKQFDIMTEIDGIEFVTDTKYIPGFTDGLSIDYVNEPIPGFIIKSLKPITKSDCGGCSGCNKNNKL